MAKLSAAGRKKIPKSQMGLPAKATRKGGAVSGSYPMPDKAHARAALSLLHNAPAAQQPKIRAKANKVLGKQAGGKGKAKGSAGTSKSGRASKP